MDGGVGCGVARFCCEYENVGINRKREECSG